LRWIYAEQPLFHPGKPGRFDNGTLLPASQFVTHNDQHWIYYKGCKQGHEERPPQGQADCRIGLVRFELDSLSYLTPDLPEEWSSVTTKRFLLSGTGLEINMGQPNPGTFTGQMRITILDGDTSMPFPGFSCQDADVISRPGVRKTVTWRGNGDLGALKGKKIRLQFHFIRATLKAFQVLP